MSKFRDKKKGKKRKKLESPIGILHEEEKEVEISRTTVKTVKSLSLSADDVKKLVLDGLGSESKGYLPFYIPEDANFKFEVDYEQDDSDFVGATITWYENPLVPVNKIEKKGDKPKKEKK